MACKTCGGTMVGDGYTFVRHCENVDVSGGCFEPDAGPIYCTMSDEPESTEQNRVWHSGPPPYVGWWNASVGKNPRVWRWWDGICWSAAISNPVETWRLNWAVTNPIRPSADRVKWNDYWPADARVPRLAPEDFEVGARWVCVKPTAVAFVGEEVQVRDWHATGLHLSNDLLHLHIKPNELPSEHFVPRRCVGPQTRWDFPMPKDSPVPGHMALLFEAYAFGQFADDFDRPLPLTVRAALRKHLDEQLDTRYVAQKAKEACHG